MLTKKRAALLPELLAGRTARKRRSTGTRERQAAAPPPATLPVQPPERWGIAPIKGAKRSAVLSAALMTAPPVVKAARSAFFRKGAASAATFRPSHWRY